jgi:transcriptional regulator with XRE-family HTH domain
MGTVTTAAGEKAWAVEVGQNLRHLRRSRGLSLAHVEALSEGRWPATVVGSYERANRQPSIGRLASLAAWYGVEAGEVLPSRHPVTVVSDAMARSLPVGQVAAVSVHGRIVFLRLREAS